MALSRRALIASVAALAAAAAGSWALLRHRGPPHRVLSAAEKSSCGLTVEAVEGPYFVSGMPEATGGNLNASGLKGEAMELTGHVYDGATGTTPIAGAAVEIWHADSDRQLSSQRQRSVLRLQARRVGVAWFRPDRCSGPVPHRDHLPRRVHRSRASLPLQDPRARQTRADDALIVPPRTATNSPSTPTTSPRAYPIASSSYSMQARRPPERASISGVAERSTIASAPMPAKRASPL